MLGEDSTKVPSGRRSRGPGDIELLGQDDAQPSGRRWGSFLARQTSSTAVPLGVRPVQVACFLCATMASVVVGALFDAYLLDLQNSNEFVGKVESACGLAALVIALPIGWAADHWSKTGVMRANSVMGLVSVGLLALGIPTDNVLLIVIGAVTLAMHNQVFYGVYAPLLSEMTRAGEQRTKVLSDTATMSSLGRACGPALQLLAIWASGRSTWNRDELHWILCLGLLLSVPYTLCVWLIRVEEAPAREVPLTEAREGRDSERPRRRRSSDLSSFSSATSERSMKRRWAVATLLEIGSLGTAIGSGMTFKFWPLFFKTDYNFTPAEVCVLQLLIWVTIAMFSQLSPWSARLLGRAPSCVISHYIGTGLLFVISFGGPVFAIVPLVLFRNAVMNSNVPIIQSMIMDLVPREHRGKWSSIASLRRMTWSGSAFIGGFLSDRHDYRYAFFITACAHACSGAFIAFVALLRLRDGERPPSGA